MPFEHLRFARQWKLSADTVYQLGQCHALATALCMVPLRPEVKRKLKETSLIKGAQATTAIEGNTLTEKEIQKIIDGRHLGKGRAYQAREVANVIEAMNQILEDALTPSARAQPDIITPELLRHYHRLVGANLPEPFGAIAGEFAQSQRVVGGYRCPPPGRGKDQVEGLVKRLCEWLRTEFGFTSGQQSFMDGIVQSIVTHVYIEWIHPFDDGNGRTGRLVEFYLLLRAGVPDICAHILSNHYNNTRPEYYEHIRKSQNESQLTSFIAYAVDGFLDGLKAVWKTVAGELLERAWQGHVDDQLANLNWSAPTLNRRRRLALGIALMTPYSIESIQLASPKIAREYAAVSLSTVKRDIRNLLEAGLLTEDSESKEISANIGVLVRHYPTTL